MWLFSTYGFFSVVSDYEDSSKVLVRARNILHLVELRRRFKKELGNVDIKTTPMADYRSRMSVKKRVWAQIVRKLAEEIEYRNFKSEAARYDDSVYVEALHDVWGRMLGMQESVEGAHGEATGGSEVGKPDRRFGLRRGGAAPR
jgi:hypothetical protein